jgi:hypothetical protein
MLKTVVFIIAFVVVKVDQFPEQDLSKLRSFSMFQETVKYRLIQESDNKIPYTSPLYSRYDVIYILYVTVKINLKILLTHRQLLDPFNSTQQV